MRPSSARPAWTIAPASGSRVSAEHDAAQGGVAGRLRRAQGRGRGDGQDRQDDGNGLGPHTPLFHLR